MKIHVVELTQRDFKAVRKALRWENRFHFIRESTATLENIAYLAKLPTKRTQDILDWMFQDGEIIICTNAYGYRTYR